MPTVTTNPTHRSILDAPLLDYHRPLIDFATRNVFRIVPKTNNDKLYHESLVFKCFADKKIDSNFTIFRMASTQISILTCIPYSYTQNVSVEYKTGN